MLIVNNTDDALTVSTRTIKVKKLYTLQPGQFRNFRQTPLYFNVATLMIATLISGKLTTEPGFVFIVKKGKIQVYNYPQIFAKERLNRRFECEREELAGQIILMRNYTPFHLDIDCSYRLYSGRQVLGPWPRYGFFPTKRCRLLLFTNLEGTVADIEPCW